MGAHTLHRLLWGTPLVLGLALGQSSCLGWHDGDRHDGYVYGPVATANPVTHVALADLNGDGRLDIVDSVYLDGGDPWAGFLSVRLQSPATAGSYLAPLQFAAGANPAALVAARLSPGARPGVVLANQAPWPQAANTVSVLFPDPGSAGALLPPLALAVGARNPLDVVVADLNGDGYPDLAVAADGGNSILLFTQKAGGGAFNPPVSVDVGGVPQALASADLNGDGIPDLAVATASGMVAVLFGNGDGTFRPHQDYAVGANPVSLKVADLDGDGRPDIVVANNGLPLGPTWPGVSVLLQNPAPAAAGSFKPALGYDTGDSYATSVAVADLDGDGRPDLAVAHYGRPGLPGSVAVLLQSAASPGTFKAPVNYPGVTGPTSVAIGDIDGDGLPDLVLGDGGLFVRPQLPGKPGVFGAPVPYRQ